MNAACACLLEGPREFERIDIGIDSTAGRFAEVEIRVCRKCGTQWVHYFYEMEAFTASGRWYCGILNAELERGLRSETAADVLAAMPDYVCGGSYFGSIRRSTGPLFL